MRVVRPWPSCPEKPWLPPPWQGSRPGWMELWAPWAGGRGPCPWQGGLGQDDLQGPIQPKPFRDAISHLGCPPQELLSPGYQRSRSKRQSTASLTTLPFPNSPSTALQPAGGLAKPPLPSHQPQPSPQPVLCAHGCPGIGPITHVPVTLRGFASAVTTCVLSSSQSPPRTQAKGRKASRSQPLVHLWPESAYLPRHKDAVSESELERNCLAVHRAQRGAWRGNMLLYSSPHSQLCQQSSCAWYCLQFHENLSIYFIKKERKIWFAKWQWKT